MAQSYDGTGWKLIFPSAKRANTSEPAGYTGTPFLLSRKMTEWNVTNIIRMLADNDSFVISDAFDSAKDFEFCIHGYYFCISADQFNIVTGLDSGSVWAQITLTLDADTKDGYSELDSISFNSLGPTNSDPGFWLQLLDDNRLIPQGSLIKFKKDSLAINDIANDVLGRIQTIDGNS